MAKLMARVKQNSPANMLMAFGGHEYVKYEWRPVPGDPKIEDQAKKHEGLEVMDAAKVPAPAPAKAAAAKKPAAKAVEPEDKISEPDED